MSIVTYFTPDDHSRHVPELLALRASFDAKAAGLHAAGSPAERVDEADTAAMAVGLAVAVALGAVDLSTATDQHTTMAELTELTDSTPSQVAQARGWVAGWQAAEQVTPGALDAADVLLRTA